MVMFKFMEILRFVMNGWERMDIRILRNGKATPVWRGCAGIHFSDQVVGQK